MAMNDMDGMKYDNYNDYLESFVTTEDKQNLLSKSTCAEIVKLNYRSINPVLTESKFHRNKKVALELLRNKAAEKIILFGDYLRDTDDGVLVAFKERESLNVKKIVSTIIYIRHRTKAGFEISGFIDYENSLYNAKIDAKGCVNWQAVFEGRRLLKPDSTELSFRDAHKKIISYNESRNYKVLHDFKYGMLFLHRGDRKIIPLGPNPPSIYKDNVKRSVVRSDRYGLVILYDHAVRRRY